MLRDSATVHTVSFSINQEHSTESSLRSHHFPSRPRISLPLSHLNVCYWVHKSPTTGAYSGADKPRLHSLILLLKVHFIAPPTQTHYKSKALCKIPFCSLRLLFCHHAIPELQYHPFLAVSNFSVNVFVAVFHILGLSLASAT